MDIKKLNYYYNKFKFGEDNFHNLMKKRVQEILLVSTFYDAFIFEQDGRLSEQIFGEYMQLNLSTAPRITSVPTGYQALEILNKRKFDLVITMMRIGELSPFELSKKIKEKYPNLPILLLLNVKNDVALIDKNGDDLKYIENVFIWSGDSKIFLAMVKYIEDIWNVENDTEIGLVRVILLVEDSMHYYSMFHPLLYSEIMKQTQRLITEELNDINKRQRMRARPKVLLVHTFEDALKIYKKYEEYIIAIISDVRFSKNGVLKPKAGIEFITELRKLNVRCPILLQSSEIENKKYAEELGVNYLDKNSKTLLHDLSGFILKNLGFGDFIFRNKDGTEIYRAHSTEEFEEKLQYIPDESLIYHSSKHNFSSWLTAHGEFLFAKRIRGFDVNDFDSKTSLRKYLISIFKEVHYLKNRGKIIKFNPKSLNIDEGIIRLAEGSLGGKGRGIAFLNALLVSMEFEKKFPRVKIRIPKTFVIGTSEYDRFIEENDLEVEFENISDSEIKKMFLNGKISNDLESRLRILISSIHYPLAIRSSGLLEDSQSQPFAGIYETYMLPNNNEDENIRLFQLKSAIKLIFASVFMENARNYIESINFNLEEEKMAVIIQEVVGTSYDGYFYPHISGVGQSYNFYPTSFLKNEDNIATLAIGLGKSVVEGGNVFRFCPNFPETDIVHQTDMMGMSQKYLYAINLRNKLFDFKDGEESTLVKLKVKQAETHGSLNNILSVWDYENNRIVEDLSIKGPRIATFAKIIKYNAFPLARIIKEILEIGEKAMGVAVEIEFAVNLTKDPYKQILPTFYILQIRPLNVTNEEIIINSGEITMDNLMLYTKKGMGNGVISNLTNIVYLKPARFDRTKTMEMQHEIAEINSLLKKEGKNYILIAPGRWGSRDRFLGIPVKWHEIDFAKIIVEAGIKNFVVDASQGTHFFHNLVSMNVGYFSVPYNSPSDFIDWNWLNSQTHLSDGKYFSRIEASEPFIVKMDGRKGISFIHK